MSHQRNKSDAALIEDERQALDFFTVGRLLEWELSFLIEKIFALADVKF